GVPERATRRRAIELHDQVPCGRNVRRKGRLQRGQRDVRGPPWRWSYGYPTRTGRRFDLDPAWTDDAGRLPARLAERSVRDWAWQRRHLRDRCQPVDDLARRRRQAPVHRLRRSIGPRAQEPMIQSSASMSLYSESSEVTSAPAASSASLLCCSMVEALA